MAHLCVVYRMHLNFRVVYISQILIFADFMFLNSRMLAIVLCVSFDVEIFVDGCYMICKTANIKPHKNLSEYGTYILSRMMVYALSVLYILINVERYRCGTCPVHG